MTKSLDEFKELLIASRLITSVEIEAILHKTEADSAIDCRGLAIELVRQKKLTPYQTQQIYQGRGKNLSLGNYLVLEKLGQGGMGTVLKSRHRRMDRIVALKMLIAIKSRDALRRFQREVKAAAKLVHQNIVTAYDADEANGIHFLVMEYVEGNDLSALVRANGPLSVETAISCVLQAAHGLEYSHRRGVIHRDVKPSNLLMRYDGLVKVLDVGLARSNSEESENGPLTDTGDVLGTIDFMAPEQAADPRQADQRADIYSLGATMWYLLTGRPLFEGETPVAKLIAHYREPVPSLSNCRADVPAVVEEILRRMVAKNPGARYQSMPELIADLMACSQTGRLIQVPAKAAVDETAGWDVSQQTDLCARSSAPLLVVRPAPAQFAPTKLYRPASIISRTLRDSAKYVAATVVGLILVSCATILWFSNRHRSLPIQEEHPQESQAPQAAVAPTFVGPFQPNSVWVNDNLNWTLKVTERKGESFKAVFTLGDKHIRNVTGTVKAKTVTWLATDTIVVKGAAGNDNFGTIVSNNLEDKIDVVWREANGGSGTYTLYLQPTAPKELPTGIVNGDFSSGLDGWKKEGETEHFKVFKGRENMAFTTGPRAEFSKHVGRIYQSFTVPENAEKLECFLHGSSSTSTYVALREGDSVIWKQSGPNCQTPVRYERDIKNLRGKKVTFEIVDQNRGSYGYIGVHGIRILVSAANYK